MINEIKKFLASYLPGNTTSDLAREPVPLGKVITHQQPNPGEDKSCPYIYPFWLNKLRR